MNRYLLTMAAALGLAAATFAQQPAAQPAQGPKPKSQKELQALQQVQAATTPQQRMQAIDNVLENFTDTEYKHVLLDMAVQSAQQANDSVKVEFYSDQALKNDPKDVTAELALAGSTLQNTKEFDLDKEQKLTKAEGYANGAIEALKTASSPNPQMSDAQWQQTKKQMTAEGYADLGAVAVLRKKYDVALTNYKTAAEDDPEPVILVRLASTYNDAKQPDNAITTCDRVLAMSDAPPQVKQYAEQIKATAQKAKAAPAAK